jgi:hypothetical protein
MNKLISGRSIYHKGQDIKFSKEISKTFLVDLRLEKKLKLT